MTHDTSGDPERLARRLHWLARRLSAAQKRWDLLADGDRVLVGLSGGKDSLVLLHLLLAWRRTAPLDLAVEALHVEMDGAGCAHADREALAGHAAQLGVPLAFARAEVPAAPPGAREVHPCFPCARRRREVLLRHAAARGCGKVALAHHLDDAAETVLMNMLFRGKAEGLAPRRAYDGGRIVLVRPLLLAEERRIADAAVAIGFRTVTCRSDAAETSRRRDVKRFLASLGKEADAAKRHLCRLAGAD